LHLISARSLPNFKHPYRGQPRLAMRPHTQHQVLLEIKIALWKIQVAQLEMKDCGVAETCSSAKRAGQI
jgi:hypothetical protein